MFFAPLRLQRISFSHLNFKNLENSFLWRGFFITIYLLKLLSLLSISSECSLIDFLSIESISSEIEKEYSIGTIDNLYLPF